MQAISRGSSQKPTPSVVFSRAGNLNPNTWLYFGENVSNSVGAAVTLLSPSLKRIDTRNKQVDTYTIEIYEHEGGGVNLTLVDSFSITSAKAGTKEVDLDLTEGRQLAVKISAGNVKDINVQLILDGIN